MPRRASLIVFLGLIVALVFVTGISAGARPGDGVQSKEAEIVAAQDRLMEIRVNVSTAQAAYDNALFEMNHLNGKIAKTKDDLDAAKEDLAEAQQDLEERASQVYRSGNVAFMDVLVGVDNFSEFATRLDLWMRLLGQERAEFEAVRAAKNELAAYKTDLEAKREQRIEAVEEAVAHKERATEAEAEAEAYLNSLNADLRGALQAEQERQIELARAAVEDSAPVQADEPEPIPQVEVSQVEQAPVPQPDLEDEQAAAERAAAAQAAAEEAQRLAEERAAERAAAMEAEEQAAAEEAAAEEAAMLAEKTARQEAKAQAAREAELAAQRAAEERAAREKAEREAELAAERAAIEQAAAEQAAAERAAAQRAAEERAAAEQAERQAALEAEAAAARAARQAELEDAAAAQAARQAELEDAAAAQAERQAELERRAAAKRDAAEASASASASPDAPRNPSDASASAAPAPAGGRSGAGGSGSAVVAEAQKYMGTPYVLGGEAECVPYEAMDCSCLTMTVYSAFGFALPDNPGAQMGYGTPVSGAPIAGDLVFWSEDGSGMITHVGIAMGDGTAQTIHAQIGNQVTTTPIDYIPGYAGARRLL